MFDCGSNQHDCTADMLVFISISVTNSESVYMVKLFMRTSRYCFIYAFKLNCEREGN